MRRIVTLVACIGLLASATTALGTTIWDYTADYSTTSNSTSDVWQRGYLTEPTPGTWGLNLYDTFQSFSGEIAGWDKSGDPDTNGNANKNTSASAYENWGDYWEAGQTCVMPGVLGNYGAVRWVAPAAGTYSIFAQWTDQRTDGTGATVGIHVAGNSLLWSDTTNGFYGRAANGFADRTGTHQSTAYTNSSMYFTAGQYIDFVVENMWADPVTYRMMGFTATISQVPEPSVIVLLASGLTGLLAYAWRKRK